MNRFLEERELGQRATGWARTLQVDSASVPRLTQPALCILDMQNDFLRADGAMPVWGGPAIIPGLAALLRAFRVARRPVFFSRHICLDPVHAAELGVASRIRTPQVLLRDGTGGAEIVEELRPADDEHVITKYRYSAFYGSPLEPLLRAHAVHEVVITGVVTNVCCETTAHDAFFRDFGIVFTLDGTGGLDEASHLASLATIRQSYGQVVSVAQVLQALDELGSGS